MKKAMSLGLLTMVVLALQVIPSRSAFSLSPPVCYSQNSCSPKQACQFENIDRNWPESTGYHRDCNHLSDQEPVVRKYMIPFVGAAGALLVALTILAIRKRLKTKSK